MRNVTQRGFTILEMLVAVSIFGFLTIGIATMFLDVFIGSKQQFLAVSNVDQARLVTSQFLNELRNATTGVDGSFSLGQADDTQIIFYSKSLNSATVNRFRYYLAETTLYKGTIIPTGNPLVYNVASESVKIVQNDVKNTPIFFYYNDTYTEGQSALPQPVNLNNVKFVKINITVLTQVKNNSNTTFSISRGVAIRNLKTNLGN